jgi:PAS domain S-box-containing protein
VSGADIAGLKSRTAALRQAATLPRADERALLDAALAELDGAIQALSAARGSPASDGDDRSLSGLHSDRRVLQAIFAATPVPLFVTDHDGTVLRANAAACQLMGIASGYATGRQLAAFTEPAARAAIRSQLAAVARTGKTARLRSAMLADRGTTSVTLTISPVPVRGDSGRFLVTVGSAGALPADETASDVAAGLAVDAAAVDAAAVEAAAVAAATRRLDMLAAATRLLLESATISESVLLQRCARLLAGELATWVIVDVRRRGQLRRHYVAGPDDHESAGIAHAVATVDPGPGTAPDQVIESGDALLVAHADDDMLLGKGSDGVPLLPVLGAASVLSVPVDYRPAPGRTAADNSGPDRTAADRTGPYGVLTLVRRADHGQFGLADAALAGEIGSLLALATSGRRVLRRRTEAAEALRASLLPPVLKPVPGVEIACAHMAPTRGREVGGDFYDAYPTPGGWGVAIGDVCGKGEDAAAATAAARHAIRVLAHSDSDPVQVLRGANDIMLAEEFGGRFVTASAAHLSWQDGTLRVRLASAGHPGPVLLKPDGRARLIPGGGVALGIFADPEPAILELELSSGDVLFFYTDGLADARSADATYLENRLGDDLASLAGRHAAEIVSEMRESVLDFCAGVLLDDLTMLVLQVGTPPR